MILNILLALLMAVTSVATSFFAAGDAASSASATTNGYVQLTPAVRQLYSREILFEAQPRLRFTQFAKKKTDFQAVRGKSIVFTKYHNLGGDSALNEADEIVTDNLSASEIEIAVAEHGKATKVSELLLNTSFQDVMGEASKILANHMAISIDKLLRDATLTTTNILYGDGTLADATAFNAATGNSSQAFSTATVKTMVERLASNDSPKFGGEYYVCFAHPSALRQLRDDNNWIEANKYMGRRQLYLGEVGMYEGMVFIETTQMPTYAAAADAVAAGWAGVTETATMESVAFGENAYAWGVALEPELRDDGIRDFGRTHKLAWYGIWGAGILEEKNIFKVLTR